MTRTLALRSVSCWTGNWSSTDTTSGVRFRSAGGDRFQNIPVLRDHQNRHEIDDGESQELSLLRLFLIAKRWHLKKMKFEKKNSMSISRKTDSIERNAKKFVNESSKKKRERKLHIWGGHWRKHMRISDHVTIDHGSQPVDVHILKELLRIPNRTHLGSELLDDILRRWETTK